MVNLLISTFSLYTKISNLSLTSLLLHQYCKVSLWEVNIKSERSRLISSKKYSVKSFFFSFFFLRKPIKAWCHHNPGTARIPLWSNQSLERTPEIKRSWRWRCGRCFQCSKFCLECRRPWLQLFALHVSAVSFPRKKGRTLERTR